MTFAPGFGREEDDDAAKAQLFGNAAQKSRPPPQGSLPGGPAPNQYGGASQGYQPPSQSNRYNQRDDDPNRNQLFGNAPQRVQQNQQSGAYGRSGAYGDDGAAGGYGAYGSTPKTAEEEEEEDIQATKHEMRNMKREV